MSLGFIRPYDSKGSRPAARKEFTACGSPRLPPRRSGFRQKAAILQPPFFNLPASGSRPLLHVNYNASHSKTGTDAREESRARGMKSRRRIAIRRYTRRDVAAFGRKPPFSTCRLPASASRCPPCDQFR